MFFDYQSGYQVNELLGQIKGERKVAREMGLERRSVLLGHMENLVCHFHGCNYIGAPFIEPANGMSPGLIKMKMVNEARKILFTLDKSESLPQQRSDIREQKSTIPAKTKKPPSKIYKYPCHICKREYSHIANHLKHAHKLKTKEINQAKHSRKQAKETNRNTAAVKRALKPCPMKGCSWVGRRFDYHLPKSHKIEKGSDKYKKIIGK